MRSKTAIKILLILLSLVIFFHLSILVKITPYEIAWGGRLETDAQMYVFETISIFINLFLIVVLLIKGAYLSAFIPIKVVDVLLWIFFVLFVLNTVGNLFAKTNFEKFFAIVTFAFSLLIFVVLKRKDAK